LHHQKVYIAEWEAMEKEEETEETMAKEQEEVVVYADEGDILEL